MLGSLGPLLAQSGGSGGYSTILFLILPFALLYFFLMRPQQRQRRAHRELIQSLAVGDEVITIGGAYGTIRELDDESVTIEVDDDVQIRFLRSAIARKLVFDDEPYEGEESEEDRQGAGEQS